MTSPALFKRLNELGYIVKKEKGYRFTKKGEKIGKYKENDKGEKFITWPENLDEILDIKLIKKNQNANVSKAKTNKIIEVIVIVNPVLNALASL